MTDTTEQALKIRQLNDAFRMRGEGYGTVMLTMGIQALGGTAIMQILNTIRCYDSFSADEDPWNEHDFGVLNFEGTRVFWKIDYYDRSVQYGSEDPTDPDKTYRALTIMLADEY